LCILVHLIQILKLQSTSNCHKHTDKVSIMPLIIKSQQEDSVAASDKKRKSDENLSDDTDDEPLVQTNEGPRRSGRSRRTVVPKGTFGDDSTTEEEDDDGSSVEPVTAPKKRKIAPSKKNKAAKSKSTKGNTKKPKKQSLIVSPKNKTMPLGTPLRALLGSSLKMGKANASPSIQAIKESSWRPNDGDWRTSGAIDY
jgi:hypothetical protein